MAKAKKAATKSTGKRGRPPQTEEQKAAKKASKDAAAAAAAPPKPAESSVSAESPAPAEDKKPKSKSADLPSADEQKLFLSHLPIIAAQKAKLETANSDLRNLYKKAKADGFEKADFDLAMAIETAEKEAKQKAKIARELTIAKFCGKALGNQLDLFLEPDRTPASENAYEEGKIAAMKNEAARPGYDPSTEQHREYMRGYHDVQGAQIKDGIKPLDDTPKGSQPAAAPAQAAPAAAPKPAPVQQPPATAPAAKVAQEPPTSGMRMTRADYLREQEMARQREAEEREKREERARSAAPPPASSAPPVATDEDDDEGSSMFRRRSPAPAA